MGDSENKKIWRDYDEIPMVGSIRANQALWDAGYRTFDDLRKATQLELEEVDGIGWQTAKAIKDKFHQ